ncbi:hypothetical protein [Microvirga sp. M2]|uniref:hypothetical protein n=1 Tax=Microvirga sp. M2 TaxID=3073270 RepID=UPI0039C4873E
MRVIKLSVNPSAFNWLRRQAYAYANEHGSDREALQAYCSEKISQWRQNDPEGKDLDEKAARELALDVANWVAAKYNPKRRSVARKTREMRALEEVVITYFTEELEEQGRKPTVRAVADLAEHSKTKAGRLLNLQGVAPRRTAKVVKLSRNAQRLYAIFDQTMPRDGSMALSHRGLMDLMWPKKAPAIEPKKSTRSMQKTRLSDLMNELQQARLGFHALVVGDIIALRRGRRWKSLKDAEIWVNEERERQQVILPASPQEKVSQNSFWRQPEIQTCIGLMELAAWGDIRAADQAMPVITATRALIDYRPLLSNIHRALNTYNWPDVVENLFRQSGRIENPDVARAVRKIANVFQVLFHGGRYGWPAHDVLADAFRTTGFLDRVESSDPRAGQRIRYLWKTVIQGSDDCPTTIALCRTLENEERQGRWTPEVASDGGGIGQVAPLNRDLISEITGSAPTSAPQEEADPTGDVPF